jgi:outer membrane immunogenic protein
LPYLTGGVAFGSMRMTPGVSTSTDTATSIGLVVGFGMEYAFKNSWSAKLEYLYADLGKSNCGAAACGMSTDVKFSTNIVRLGLNYRF